MKPTRHTGYRSFSYLEADVDYTPFELAREVGRVSSRRVEASPAEEGRALRLLDEHIVISLHDHVTVAPRDVAKMPEYRRQGREWTGYEGLAASGLDCVFDALMGGTATITSRAGWKWDDVIYDLGMRLADIAHQKFVVRAGTLEEIRAAKAADQLAFVPCLESAAPIENELDRLDILYGLGVRSVGIAYSEANAPGARRVRTGYVLRRPRWPAPLLRTAVLARGEPRRPPVSGGRVCRRHRKSRGVLPEHRPLARAPWLLR